ncbi:MAG: Holliday junction resolvase RuvX [Eubacterium sp.]|nr:Holliday junction resolvase RuvX [Eubacterium sp.]
MRLMGLDYGDKTVGVAISDALGLTAQPLETIFRERKTKLRRTLSRIDELVAEYGVELIVLGYPLEADGTEGDRCRATREFAETLMRRTNLPVELEDERLTTVESDEILRDMGVAPEDRKSYIDKIAASVILRQYMENAAS